MPSDSSESKDIIMDDRCTALDSFNASALERSVKAEVKIDQHLIECAQHRVATERALTGIRLDLSKQTKTIALITGAIVAGSRTPEIAKFITSLVGGG